MTFFISLAKGFNRVWRAAEPKAVLAVLSDDKAVKPASSHPPSSTKSKPGGNEKSRKQKRDNPS